MLLACATRHHQARQSRGEAHPDARRIRRHAKRQLAVARSLFERGKMPAAGQAIIEGVAWAIPYKKLARELHLTVDTVKSRLKTMREVFGEEIEELGMRSK